MSPKTAKNFFQVYVAVWVLFLRFLCRLRSGIYLNNGLRSLRLMGGVLYNCTKSFDCHI